MRLVHLHHRHIATHAGRHALDKQAAGCVGTPGRDRKRPTAPAVSVTRKVNPSGNVCFDGQTFRVGSTLRPLQVQVPVVGDTVEISIDTGSPLRAERVAGSVEPATL